MGSFDLIDGSQKPRSNATRKLFIVGVGAIIVGFVIGILIGRFATCPEPSEPEKIPEKDGTFLPGIPESIIQDGDPEIGKQLIDAVDNKRIEEYLRHLTVNPHVAGSQSNLDLALWMKQSWEDAGFDDVKLTPYDVLLSFPDPNNPNVVRVLNGSNHVMYESPLKEANLTGEERDDALPPYNAYSPAGQVEGDMVYVNYGRVEDYVWLENNASVNVSGKIAIARYGKIFRGSKVAIAADHGAIGIVIYSDPADYADDSDPRVYPETWWLPGSGAQRGTIFTGGGDPLTPGYPATKNAYRYEETSPEAGLPTIPAHPIGYDIAKQMLGSTHFHEFGLTGRPIQIEIHVTRQIWEMSSGCYKRKGHNTVKVWGQSKRTMKMPMHPLSAPSHEPELDNNCDSSIVEKCPPDIQTGTVHQQKMLSLANSWEQIRTMLIKLRVKNMAPHTKSCTLCAAEQTNIIRCLDCGPRFLLCGKCSSAMHSHLFMHSPEMWMEHKGMFIPLEDVPHVKLTNHESGGCSKYNRNVAVFDQYGNPRTICVEFCSCQSDAATLLSYGLWPGTPHCPNVAFDIKLLEYFTVLQLECHISAKGFCGALGHIQDFRIRFQDQVRSLHRAFSGEVAAEYRFHRHQLQSTTALGSDVTIGPECPICIQDCTTPIVCMDGNFGLVQKQNAGSGQGSTRNTDLFFLSQANLHRFVDDYSVDKKTSNECSNFQAGSAVRSKAKNAKLRYKGIFGSICQHEVPLKFLNLEHGERLAYPVHLISELLKKKPEGTRMIVMYDIACLLHRHLQKRDNKSVLNAVSFSVPVFHSFAHNMECKMTYGQRNVKDTGLCDGEGTERLWAYLRPFSKITKEMTERNRHDLLSDALHHHSVKQITKMAENLQKKKRSAEMKMSSAIEMKQSIMSSLNATDEDIRQWAEILKKPKSGQRSVSRVQDQASALKEMQDLAIERQYLLSCLKKYADGQDTALRLSRKVSNVTNKLKKSNENLKLDVALDFSQVSNPDSVIYMPRQLSQSHVEAVEVHNLTERCQEELVSLSRDRILYCSAIGQKNDVIKELLDIEQIPGSRFFLSLQKLKLEQLLLKCQDQFTDVKDFDAGIIEFLSERKDLDTPKYEAALTESVGFGNVVDSDEDSDPESDEDLED